MSSLKGIRTLCEKQGVESTVELRATHLLPCLFSVKNEHWQHDTGWHVVPLYPRDKPCIALSIFVPPHTCKLESKEKHVIFLNLCV